MILKVLIEESLVESLQEQIGHEKYNANLYLYIAGFLKNKGFNNIAKHFVEQHAEETGHSLMIFDLMTDLNAPIKIPEIDAIDMPINSIMEIAEAYLNREILTTESLDEIKKLAIEQSNPVVEEFMRKMLVLQQNEYAEATDFMDKSQLTGNDWKWVFMWDIGLGA
jgi:ferritin